MKLVQKWTKKDYNGQKSIVNAEKVQFKEFRSILTSFSLIEGHFWFNSGSILAIFWLKFCSNLAHVSQFR